MKHIKTEQEFSCTSQGVKVVYGPSIPCKLTGMAEKYIKPSVKKDEVYLKEIHEMLKEMYPVVMRIEAMLGEKV